MRSVVQCGGRRCKRIRLAGSVRAVQLNYSEQPLSTDQQHFERTAMRISQITQQLEIELAGPQDIEGVVSESGEIFVVQSRPQA